ncbi:serine protease SP24D-like [Leptidea sinapis]|uniref:serine protease SP24D-like n=1 Tax=Leptidea sinapis TaxID=189913 RepID=UPI0021C45037|nr:serine protease SP24D-like [Leptidea sinapis]
MDHYGIWITVALAECTLQPHIVDGIKTSIYKFPHSVFLIVDTNVTAIQCGGSIINQRIILTAAHCLYNVRIAADITSYAGSARAQDGEEFETLRYAIHDAFKEQTLANDIALILLKRSLPLGAHMKRIAVYRIPPVRTFGIVAGWGLLYDNPMVDTKWLHATRLKVWTRRECIKVIPGIPKGTLCAGDLKNTGHASKGDSGSALVVDNFIQIGIVSFRKHSIITTLGGYTNVSYHYTWIAKTARRLYCKKKKHNK